MSDRHYQGSTVYDQILRELIAIHKLLEERLQPPMPATMAPRRPGPPPGERLELKPLPLRGSRGARFDNLSTQPRGKLSE